MIWEQGQTTKNVQGGGTPVAVLRNSIYKKKDFKRSFLILLVPNLKCCIHSISLLNRLSFCISLQFWGFKAQSIDAWWTLVYIPVCTVNKDLYINALIIRCTKWSSFALLTYAPRIQSPVIYQLKRHFKSIVSSLVVYDLSLQPCDSGDPSLWLHEREGT